MEAPQTDSPYLPDGRQWAWDSTSLGLAKDCPRKYYLAQRWGYRPKDESVHLTFGKHYATALERYHKYRALERSHKNAVYTVIRNAMTESYGQLDAEVLKDLIGVAKYKTRENLIRSIIWYLDQFENDPCETVTLANGDAAVELSFKFQLTDEIWLTGHLDRLVSYAGEIYVQDQKTTGSTLGSYYFKRYNPDNQMSLYTAASAIVFGAPVKGVMIDAAQIAAGFTRFERGFTFRTPEQTAEWLKDAEYHIKLTWAAAEHSYPMNDSACQKYGGCPFVEVCSKSPQVRDDFLATGFEKRFWNPLEVR
jgi:hypothetical protein